jgi:hypothetical protein
MNLEEVLKELEIDFKRHGEHHHTSAGWVNIDCPYCSPDWKKYRLGIHLNTHVCNCHACGRHRLWETLAEITGLNSSKISKYMRDVEREVPVEKKPRGKLVLPKGLGPLMKPHNDYLKKARKFNTDKLVKLWEVKGIMFHATLSWRVFIPIFYLGTMVSYTTRTIRDDIDRRYISADPEHEAISHKELLYGEDYCRSTVVVCEGPTDVWRIGPGAVCTFGTTFTGAQVEKISKYPRRVICFDDESESQRQANELCSALEVLSGETMNVVLEGGKDPDESRAEAREIREKFLTDRY